LGRFSREADWSISPAIAGESAVGHSNKKAEGANDITSEAVSTIAGISATITRINGVSSSIASAVEEQAAMTQDMSGNMQTAAHGVESIATSLGEISRSVRSIHTATENLQHAAAAIA